MDRGDDVVVVGGGRTGFAACHGPLSGWHPAELNAFVFDHVVADSGLVPGAIDEVVVATASPVGAQGHNLARASVLAAGWPETIATHMVEADRLGGLLAVRSAAAMVAAGFADVVLAAGIELMSLVPAAGAALDRRFGQPWGAAAIGRYATEGGLVPVGVAAERLAIKHSLTRDELDRWTARSHRRALSRPASVIGVTARYDDRSDIASGAKLALDAGPDAEVAEDTLAALPPLHDEGSQLTARSLAAPGDGAAAVLVTRRDHAERLGVPELATLVGFGAAAGSPLAAAPVAAATLDSVARARLSLSDLDSIELDESSAAHALVAVSDLGVDEDRVNPLGGALAIGDPHGATGIRTLLHLIAALPEPGSSGAAAAAGEGGLALAALLRRPG